MPKPLMCRPELLQQDLSDKTYVVTGGNSGIGLATIRQLAAQGASVVLACRQASAGKRAADSIRADHPEAKIDVRVVDLASLKSVRDFCNGLAQQGRPIHGLVNNAGVMNTPKGTTQDGFETQFGVNHLGHFLLTQLLTELLIQAAPARIVNVSSCYHDQAMGREGAIHFDDLNYKTRKYDGWEAYAQSKLANLMHASELARRLAAHSISVVSVHPGWVRTRLIRNSLPVWLQNTLLRPILRVVGMIEPWEGVQTTLHALLAPEVEEQSGSYFSQLGMYRDKSLNRGGWPLKSPNPNAQDPEQAKRLWKESERLVSAYL